MKYAKQSNLKEIYGHFQMRKDLFAHVRQDKLGRMIEAGQVEARVEFRGDEGTPIRYEDIGLGRDVVSLMWEPSRDKH